MDGEYLKKSFLVPESRLLRILTKKSPLARSDVSLNQELSLLIYVDFLLIQENIRINNEYFFLPNF